MLSGLMTRSVPISDSTGSHLQSILSWCLEIKSTLNSDHLLLDLRETEVAVATEEATRGEAAEEKCQTSLKTR
jgi:hypothetical protein